VLGTDVLRTKVLLFRHDATSGGTTMNGKRLFASAVADYKAATNGSVENACLPRSYSAFACWRL